MPWLFYKESWFLPQKPSSRLQIWVKSFSWISISLTIILITLDLLQEINVKMSFADSQVQPNVVTDLAIRSQTLLDRDAQLLTTKAIGRMNSVLDPIFAGYHKRVPDFAAWAFEWRTSYSLLRRGVVTAVILPFSKSPQLQHFGEAWNDFIAEKFDELVIRPDGGGIALAMARTQWEQDVYMDIKATVTNAVLTTALLRGQDLTLWSWQPVGTNMSNTDDKNVTTFSPSLSVATSPIKMYAIRPIITRLTMRPPIAAVVTVAGETLSSYGDFGFFGTFAGIVATMAGFFSVDYLISRIDAAISQQDLEVEIHHTIDLEHERIRRAWLATVETNINLQITNANNTLEK